MKVEKENITPSIHQTVSVALLHTMYIYQFLESHHAVLVYRFAEAAGEKYEQKFDDSNADCDHYDEISIRHQPFYERVITSLFEVTIRLRW